MATTRRMTRSMANMVAGRSSSSSSSVRAIHSKNNDDEELNSAVDVSLEHVGRKPQATSRPAAAATVMVSPDPTTPTFPRHKRQRRSPSPSPPPPPRQAKDEETTKNHKRTRRNLFSTPTAETTTTTATTNVVKTITDTEAFFSLQGFCDLNVPPAELRPSATLTTGQCFHWTAVPSSPPSSAHSDSTSSSSSKTSTSAWGSHNATQWVGTVRVRDPGSDSSSSAVLVLRQEVHTTLYKVLVAPSADWDARAFLRNYFQLDVQPNLTRLYQEWSAACPRLRRIAESIPGVRILNQDPWECLVSFLCSSNNNIPRITKMLTAIRKVYGQPLVTITTTSSSSSNSENEEDWTLYSFPSLCDLKAAATDQDLRRKCGLGYRSKYLLQTMDLLLDSELGGGEDYLDSLRQEPDPSKVQEALLQFCGVGRKVADCVALFSLQQAAAIPVDVHVWKIARRDYDPHQQLFTSAKSLTPTLYQQVGDVFRQRFGPFSGWAHSLLFVAELPSFRPALPADVLEEMDQFRKEEDMKKKAQRKATKTKSLKK